MDRRRHWILARLSPRRARHIHRVFEPKGSAIAPAMPIDVGSGTPAHTWRSSGAPRILYRIFIQIPSAPSRKHMSRWASCSPSSIGLRRALRVPASLLPGPPYGGCHDIRLHARRSRDGWAARLSRLRAYSPRAVLRAFAVQEQALLHLSARCHHRS